MLDYGPQSGQHGSECFALGRHMQADRRRWPELPVRRLHGRVPGLRP